MIETETSQRPTCRGHPYRCWTLSNCQAREAVAKLRAQLQAEHLQDADAWGPLVDAIAAAIPKPLA